MPTRAHIERQRGLALVVVLWIVTLLALQVSIFNLTVRDAAALSTNELAIARGEALATAGVELAAMHLLEPVVERRWTADGGTREVAFGGAMLSISVRDEASRFDINEIDEVVLASLLRRVAGPAGNIPQWVDRIMDWRDADDDRRRLGAEGADYRRAGLSYGPRNGPFLDPTELGRVLGVPKAVAEALAPYLTTFGGDGKINPRLASKEALMMLPGASKAEIDNLLQMGQRAMESGSSPLLPYLTARTGPAFRIEVAVRSDTEPAIGRAEAVVLIGKDPGAPYRVLSWRYDARSREQGQGVAR